MATKAQYRVGVESRYDSASFETLAMFSPVHFYDDFLGADLVIPATGSPESGVRWVKKIVGAAPPTVAVTANGVNGLLACTLTSTSEKQNAEAYFEDQLCFSVLQGLVFEARFALTVLPTLAGEMVLGLISAWADGLDAATYSAFVTADGSGEIICEKDDNATDESTTSGVTLTAGVYAIARIDCTDIADIKFFVNGNRVASSTTFDWAASAANSKVQPVIGCYKASGAGVGTLTVDYVKVWQNRS